MVDAPLDTLPLYLRSGGIVPLLRPTIDTLAPTTNAEVDSFAGDPGLLYVRVGLGKSHEFTIYDGTVLKLVENDTGHTLSSKAGDLFQGMIRFEVLGLSATPNQVVNGTQPIEQRGSVDELGGDTPGWYFDESLNRLHVHAQMGEAISIEPNG